MSYSRNNVSTPLLVLHVSTCASDFYFLKSINGFLSFTSFIITFSMEQHYKTAGVN